MEESSSIQPENKVEQIITEETVDISWDNAYLESIATLFLKLEASYLVPMGTINFIIVQWKIIYQERQNKAIEECRKTLTSQNIPSENIDGVIFNTFGNDVLLNNLKLLDSNYKRKNFYKANFRYVEPICVQINRQEKKFFHYVSIKETLKSFLLDKSVHVLITLQVKPNDDPSILKDFTDVTAFKDNIFFQKNPKSWKMILYQDGVELVNPIGPPKCKHKMECIYLALGNLPPHVRFRKENIKLVALYKTKNFLQDIVYKKIVDELKEIEETGIEVSHEFIKGSLVYIAGDNL